MPDALVSNPLRINASPTKEFFIHMLTRDVLLTRAIIDLVDNSIDGAHRLRGTNSFEGLWVHIELSAEFFRVTDNCGGIPINIARNYAFRFGRPREAEQTPGSVGLFGVGMKRTFFKLGRAFSVSSRSRTEQFALNVDVDQWLRDSENEQTDGWHFDFASAAQDLEPVPDDMTGTRIEVTRLLPAVADSFGLAQFQTQLKEEIRGAHTVSLNRGLTLTVNGLPVSFLPQKLFNSELIKPAYSVLNYTSEQLGSPAGGAVRVSLYAGIAERNFHDGGWYIFCNGRLILKADQTDTTVWGDKHGMRQYHPEFAYFRGFAYFDSEQSQLLPWTTTKTGVDEDSAIYKVVQREMIELTKPVLTFLSLLEKNRAAAAQGDSSDPTLNTAVTTARAVSTLEITQPMRFQGPQPNPVPPGPRMQKIQYSKPAEEVDRVMKRIGARSFKDVGEKTFEYYLEYEGGE